MKLRHYLESKNACEEALNWLGDRTVEEMVSDCPRGDWLISIAVSLEIDKRKIILTNGHIANTVRDLMDDKRSRDMVDMAIKHGEGKATKDELDATSYASYASYDAPTVPASYAAYASAYASAAVYAACAAAYAVGYAAGYAADAAGYAADAAGYAAADAAADAAGYAAADSYASAAKTANQLETADICRKFLGAEIIEKLKEKLK